MVKWPFFPPFPLNRNPLDLIEADLVGGAVVELGGAGRLVGGDGLGVLDTAAVEQVGGDAGGPEGGGSWPPRRARPRRTLRLTMRKTSTRLMRFSLKLPSLLIERHSGVPFSFPMPATSR